MIGPYQVRYHSGQEWTWEQWQWKGGLHSLKPQHHWSLTIRLFSIMFRTLMGGVLPLCRGAVGVFYRLSWMSNWWLGFMETNACVYGEGINHSKLREKLVSNGTKKYFLAVTFYGFRKWTQRIKQQTSQHLKRVGFFLLLFPNITIIHHWHRIRRWLFFTSPFFKLQGTNEPTFNNRRCLWSNGYRYWKYTWRMEFKSRETVSAFSNSVNTLWKCKKSIIFPPAKDK